METYEKLEMEVITFEGDLIITSGGTEPTSSEIVLPDL